MVMVMVMADLKRLLRYLWSTQLVDLVFFFPRYLLIFHFDPLCICIACGCRHRHLLSLSLLINECHPSNCFTELNKYARILWLSLRWPFCIWDVNFYCQSLSFYPTMPIPLFFINGLQPGIVSHDKQLLWSKMDMYLILKQLYGSFYLDSWYVCNFIFESFSLPLMCLFLRNFLFISL